MGQRDSFSARDIAKLNYMYSCKKGADSTSLIPGETNVLPNSASTFPLLNFIANLIKPFFNEENGDNTGGETKTAPLDSSENEISKV